MLHDPEFAAAVAGRAIGTVFEHERIDFASFPSEWSAEMLYAAGELTLELALQALKSGYNLKDATPSNILFRGTEPVFVDVLSFEPRVPGESMWKPYAQFVRAFLLPLLANKYWGTTLAEVFTTHRDGFEPQDIYSRCSFFQKLRPPFLTLVTVPTLLARKGEAAAVTNVRANNDEKSLFILESLLKRLRSTLRSLKPIASRRAGWSSYMDTHSYDQQAFAAKEAFVRNVLGEFKPAKVLDIGANTGHFSRIAATLGAEVVAIDADATCVAESFQRAGAENLNVLALVVDIARPTPALGWRNSESASFMDRAVGRFDAVLMLAVVHHLLVTERVPLREIINLAADLTTSFVVLEFVPLSDPMFQRLLRGRDALHAGFCQKLFEEACGQRFEVIRAADVPGTERRLYLLKKNERDAH